MGKGVLGRYEWRSDAWMIPMRHLTLGLSGLSCTCDGSKHGVWEGLGLLVRWSVALNTLYVIHGISIEKLTLLLLSYSRC